MATRDGSGADVAVDFEQPGTLARLIQSEKPGIVVNAVAWTAVDRAESEPERAYRVNADAPAELAVACNEIDALLVHYSTDYVFDGKSRRPYREYDAPKPLNVYGVSKLAGERAIQASGVRHAIFRTSWIYSAHGNNFLKTMLRLAAERDSLQVVADQTGSPTPAHWIAQETAQILGKGIAASEIWHLAASGQTTWFGFAEAILDEAQASGLLARKPKLEAISGAYYHTQSNRPIFSVLDTTKVARDFDIAPPPWREGLRAVMLDLCRQ